MVVIITTTFLAASSSRLKAHRCLHCSHVEGGPHFFSEFVHLWHLFPMNAARILQYSQAEGCRIKHQC